MAATLNGQSSAGDASQATSLLIKAVTDLIPDSGAMTTIGADTARLTAARAGALTDWLNGGRLDLILDDILGEVEEIDGHLHAWARPIGPAASPSGTNHVADPLGGTSAPAGVQTSFTLTSGSNKDWGTPVQIWGATDCAAVLPTGYQGYFDIHRMLPTGTNEDKDSWLICVVFDDTSAADGITAGTYTIEPLFVENTDKAQSLQMVRTKRMIAGTMAWAMLAHTTNNDIKTVDAQFEAHGYPAA